MPRRKAPGFTLIELLSVLAIILILVGLMVGPVMRAYKKARNMAWENESYPLIDHFRERLSPHFGSTAEYPAFTAEQLYEGGIIDTRLRNFVRDKRVQYFPFSSKSPDETVILQVSISPNYIAVVQKIELRPKLNVE